MKLLLEAVMAVSGKHCKRVDCSRGAELRTRTFCRLEYRYPAGKRRGGGGTERETQIQLVSIFVSTTPVLPVPSSTVQTE